MERDVTRQSLNVHDREEPGSIGVEGDGLERHNALLAGDPIVIAERKPTPSKILIPSDAVKQVLERLHVVPSRRRRLNATAHCEPSPLRPVLVVTILHFRIMFAAVAVVYVAKDGNVYAGEVTTMALKKYVRK